jgi:transketolase
VEQLTALRTIPNLIVLRPGDANETAQAWKAAVLSKSKPSAIALSRQALPTLDRTTVAPAEGTLKGAYVLLDPTEAEPDIILMASGSELGLIVQAAEKLTADGIAVRLVSFPSWELFEAQDLDYQEKVIPSEIKARVSVEAGSPIGWKRWVGDQGVVLGLDHFGASAPYQELYQQFGLTVDRIVQVSKQILDEILEQD